MSSSIDSYSIITSKEKITIKSKLPKDQIKIRLKMFILFVILISLLIFLYILRLTDIDLGSTLAIIIILHIPFYFGFRMFRQEYHIKILNRRFVKQYNKAIKKQMMLSDSEHRQREKIENIKTNKVILFGFFILIFIYSIYFYYANLEDWFKGYLIFSLIFTMPLIYFDANYYQGKNLNCNIEMSMVKEKVKFWGHLYNKYEFEYKLKDIRKIWLVDGRIGNRIFCSVLFFSDVFFYSVADINYGSQYVDIINLYDYIETQIKNNEKLEHIELKHITNGRLFLSLIKNQSAKRAMVFN